MGAIKILSVLNRDCDNYGDWLCSIASRKFITGKFTHIEVMGTIVECAVIDDMVSLGEQVGTLEALHEPCPYCGDVDGHRLSCCMTNFSGL